MKVFISYSHEDCSFSNRLITDLMSHKIDVFYDTNDILVGNSIRRKIEVGFLSSDFYILIISSNSNNSEWVKIELDIAFTLEIQLKRDFIIPILIEDCEIPISIKPKKLADFTKNYEEGFKSLLNFFYNGQNNSDKFEKFDAGKPINDISFLKSVFRINYLYIEKLKISESKKNNSFYKLLSISGCLRHGTFRLVSGKLSKYYIMPIKIIQNEKAKNYFISLFIDCIKFFNKEFDMIVYPSYTNGAFLGHIIGSILGKDVYPINVTSDKRNVIIRAVDKEILYNKKCLYIDDVLTSGDGIRVAVKEFLNQGLHLEMVSTLFFRNRINYERLKAELADSKISLICCIEASLDQYTIDDKQVIEVNTIN